LRCVVAGAGAGLADFSLTVHVILPPFSYRKSFLPSCTSPQTTCHFAAGQQVKSEEAQRMRARRLLALARGTLLAWRRKRAAADKLRLRLEGMRLRRDISEVRKHPVLSWLHVFFCHRRPLCVLLSLVWSLPWCLSLSVSRFPPAAKGRLAWQVRRVWYVWFMACRQGLREQQRGVADEMDALRDAIAKEGDRANAADVECMQLSGAQ